jgi:hypothetical protein
MSMALAVTLTSITSFEGIRNMSKSDIPTICGKIYELLSPLEHSERKRAIKAALALLGDDDTEPKQGTQKKEDEQLDGGALPSRARIWMSSNSVSAEQLSQVFEIENGNVELIAAQAPGQTAKMRTVNAYVLTGLTAFLRTGEGKFDDNSARAVCKSLGCYDNTNHATYLKGKGNLISGSKDGGWILTGPGQTAAASLVKAIAGSS